MEKPGRNDPCYCGSGKKYKRCHMRADFEAERQERTRLEAARFLREALPGFADTPRFEAVAQQALPLYWNEMYTAKNEHEMSEYEALRFLDWLVFDYELDQGERILEIYHAEKHAELTPEQQALLERWLDAPAAWAYELLSYEGQLLHLRDFTSGEKVDVFEPGGRGNVEIGEVILARVVPVFERQEFSAPAAYLPADEITDLAQKLAAAQKTFATENPDASEDAFRRCHNVLLIHHALEQAQRAGRPPVARLDSQRSDAPGRHWRDGYEHDKERIHRQRTYGTTQPHLAPTRRKAI